MTDEEIDAHHKNLVELLLAGFKYEEGWRHDWASWYEWTIEFLLTLTRCDPERADDLYGLLTYLDGGFGKCPVRDQMFKAVCDPDFDAKTFAK